MFHPKIIADDYEAPCFQPSSSIQLKYEYHNRGFIVRGYSAGVDQLNYKIGR